MGGDLNAGIDLSVAVMLVSELRRPPRDGEILDLVTRPTQRAIIREKVRVQG